MNELKMTAQIVSMNIDEKIAALSAADRAYVSGYVDRAMCEYQMINGANRPCSLSGFLTIPLIDPEGNP
jgi:hypothetical protein